MCGLFGFHGARLPDRSVLHQAARLASRRGPDGWGIVTEFAQARDLGRLPEHVLAGMEPSRTVLGHCRLATVLGTKTADACQPIRVGRYVITHNGTVGNVPELEARHGFRLRTGNDSEALAHLLARAGGSLTDRLTWALLQADTGGHFAVVVLDTDTNDVEMRANRMPLWRHVAPAGTYWCSLQPAPEWEPVP